MSKIATKSILIFLLAILLFIAGSNSINFSSPDEKRYIQSADEMLKNRDWITPRYHGKPRFQKPILFYWLAAAGISVFKNSYLGARLPSVICGALVVVFTYLFGNLLYNEHIGLFSALLLVSSIIFSAYSRLATPDMTMVFFITLSLFLFCKYYFILRKSVILYSFFFILAFATLTKGLAGLLIPVIIVVIIVFVRKDIYVKKSVFILGIVTFLSITLPWFIAMSKIHGIAYIKHIWQVETVNRITQNWNFVSGIILPITNRFIRYILMVYIAFLPATLFLPKAVFYFLKQKPYRPQDLVIFVWISVVVIFFTLFGTGKIHYLLSLAPALCILMGRYLYNIVTIKPETRKPIYGFITCFMLLIVLTFGFITPVLNSKNGLLLLSNKISSMLRDGDVVGVGSHFISHNRLSLYLDRKVVKVNVDLYDPREQFEVSRRILTNFLTKNKRVFCLITRQDYEEYIPKQLKKKLFIIAKEWYWKKPNQIRFDKESFLSIFTTGRDGFNQFFKNEVYLVSNRPE